MGPPAAGGWKSSRAGETGSACSRQQRPPVDGNEIVAHDRARRRRDIVIKKQKPSGFFGSNLASYLTLLGCDSVIVTGTTTSGCVRATVVDAFSLNYRVILAEEGCFDRSEASHAVSLCDMHAKYADVVPTAEVLAYFDTARHRPLRSADRRSGYCAVGEGRRRNRLLSRVPAQAGTHSSIRSASDMGPGFRRDPVSEGEAKRMQAAIMVPGPAGGHWDIREVQRPTVPPGHVLLRVRASSINRAEFRRLHNLKTQPGKPAPEERVGGGDASRRDRRARRRRHRFQARRSRDGPLRRRLRRITRYSTRECDAGAGEPVLGGRRPASRSSLSSCMMVCSPAASSKPARPAGDRDPPGSASPRWFSANISAPA